MPRTIQIPLAGCILEGFIGFMKLLPFLFAALLSYCIAGADSVTVWFGTHRDHGIYRAKFNTANGKLTEPVQAATIRDAGFVVLHPEARVLYSLAKVPGTGEPGVAAFTIGADKSLKLLSAQPIGDGGAAHLAVDHTGSCLFTAQYGGGSVAAFPLAADGVILPRSDLHEHKGSGPHVRQKRPHPHWAGVDPDNRFLFIPDLGIDRVEIYRINQETHRLEPHASGKLAPGSGPRHMKFSADGRFAYVLNELAMTLTVFDYDGSKGTLIPIQTVETLPKELWELRNTASEVRIHPSGRFLYAGNRGHDTIAAFSVDQESGKLTFIEREPVRGSHPRNFNIGPSGRWLIAAGRDSNTLAVFEINPEDGSLRYTMRSVYCPSPICVTFDR